MCCMQGKARRREGQRMHRQRCDTTATSRSATSAYAVHLHMCVGGVCQASPFPFFLLEHGQSAYLSVLFFIDAVDALDAPSQDCPWRSASHAGLYYSCDWDEGCTFCTYKRETQLDGTMAQYTSR